jgi:L-fucose isomerase-like protein
VAAFCRSRGIECYIPDEVEDINQIFTLLKARKNFSETRILFPTDWKWPSVCSIAGINEPEKLREMFGIELVTISYEELSREMDRIRSDNDMKQEAVKMADTVYGGASRSFIEKKYVTNSMEFYQTVVSLMKQHNCNSFTIECFEFCTSRLPQKWGITPCLIHTMLKDMGIPSACEGDLGGLLPMNMLMLLSNKSPHFGNMFYYPEKGKGTMAVNHSVPGIKMNGYNKPGLPYQLSHFTDSGFGTKVIVDFMNNDVKDITVARMNPAGTGILVLKGTLVDSKGWDDETIGCHDIAYMVGKDSGTAREYVRKQADYGNHLPWVYGDYSEQLVKLGKLLDINVEVVS